MFIAPHELNGIKNCLSNNERSPIVLSLPWRRYGVDGVSNHQPYDVLLNSLFKRRPKKTSKRSVTGLCEGNSPLTGEFPAQRASNAENVSIDDVIMMLKLRSTWTLTKISHACLFVDTKIFIDRDVMPLECQFRYTSGLTMSQSTGH